jgi:hypothetical protein
MKGSDIRDQFGVNQWIEQKQVITSLDLAKRADVLPGLRQVHWELVIAKARPPEDLWVGSRDELACAAGKADSIESILWKFIHQ